MRAAFGVPADGSSGAGQLQLSAALLQHSSMREPEITLALLGTSKSVRRALHEHGRGCIRGTGRLCCCCQRTSALGVYIPRSI
jgi:hypothetical protein